jgi:RNA polymerase sigma-70 factor (ECF subfamily)
LSNRTKDEMRRDIHDWDLIGKSLEGDDRAFRTLVEKYHSLVYSVVRGIMGQRDEVEDVTQEIFIKMYRKLGTYRGEARLSTWIYRIARNEAINAVSRAHPRLEPIDQSIVHAGEEHNPEKSLERKRAKDLVETLLASLDDRHRVAIELRYMGEKSYEQIAEIMEIPIGTVKTYIYRAKAAMKEGLAVIELKGGTI